MTDAYDWIDRSLDTIKQANWYRQTQNISDSSGCQIIVDGEELINFASNDYLGLSSDLRSIDAAVAATRINGTGATGSRLVSGNRSLHDRLEIAIAKFKQTAAALVYSSGYLANIGTIAAIVDRRDVILADEYNHSSLKNGAKLSNAHTIDYQHCQIADLESKLELYRDRYRRCLIITDTVFSMDGDICPLPEILDLADRYRAMVLVDEAHGTGVFGHTGAGVVEHFGCSDRELIEVGTLSKALGSLGGYVAGSERLIDFLRNRSPSWIYTTGLSPADTAAALQAIEIIRSDRDLRDRLWENIRFLTDRLQYLPLIPSNSAIICIRLPNADMARSIGQKLRAHGIFAVGIRPPTVPTSRIRLTVMATHSRSNLQQLVDALQELGLSS
jgi:8-amino-7-oxononanoate synthase